MAEVHRLDDARRRAAAESGDERLLVVDLDGFEGPLDLLLALAHEQKVDLARLSILQLAEQFIAYIERVRRQHLEVAADYLVMAAWLAYLKSRLLLPPSPEDGAEPSPEMLAEAMAFQLQRLEAMRKASQALLARPRLGIDVFPRGRAEAVPVVTHPAYRLSFHEMLRAYAGLRRIGPAEALRIVATTLISIEDAMLRLEQMLGLAPGWTSLASFLPDGLTGLPARSAMASTFAASLELVKSGRAELRQDGAFAPLYLRPPQEAQ